MNLNKVIHSGQILTGHCQGYITGHMASFTLNSVIVGNVLTINEVRKSHGLPPILEGVKFLGGGHAT